MAGSATGVIVHYGDPASTIRVANALVSYEAEVIVVANDLSNRPCTIDGRVRWLVPKRNLGYGDAFNLAIGECPRDAYVLLNTDVVLPKATFDRCLDMLATDGVGIVGPVLRRSDGSLQSGAARLTPVRRHPRVLHDPGSRAVDCTWVTGAVMFIRGSLARQVGIDGSYFLGAEDADLCVRSARAGWRIVCCGDVSAVHEGSDVISSLGWIYYTTRNRVWWTRENFGPTPAILSWLSSLISLPRVAIADLFKRKRMIGTRLTVLGLLDAIKRKPDRADGPLAQEPIAARIIRSWRGNGVPRAEVVPPRPPRSRTDA